MAACYRGQAWWFWGGGFEEDARKKERNVKGGRGEFIFL